MKYLSALLIVFINFACAEHYIKNGKKEVLTPIKLENRSSMEGKFYITKNGIKLGVGDSLFVKFKNEDFLDKYMKKYNLFLLQKVTSNLYLFRVHDKNMTLKTANSLSEEKGVIYAHPNFKKSVKLR